MSGVMHSWGHPGRLSRLGVIIRLAVLATYCFALEFRGLASVIGEVKENICICICICNLEEASRGGQC